MAKALLFSFVALWAVMVFAPAVYAISAPASGSFAYEVYDIAVKKILEGPVGFVSGVAAVVIGCVSAITGRIMAAVPAIIGGAVMLKADDVVSTLGLLF